MKKLIFVCMLICSAAHAQVDFVARGLAARALAQSSQLLPVTERGPTAADACTSGDNWIYAGKAWTCAATTAPNTAAVWNQVAAFGKPFDIAPGMGFGTRLMSSSYTGPMAAFEDQGNTQSPKVVNFLANGAGDWATADAFAQTYPHAYAKTWYNQGTLTGSGYDAASGQIVSSATLVSSTGTYGGNAIVTMNTAGCTSPAAQPAIIITGAFFGGIAIKDTGICPSNDMNATQTVASCTGVCGTAATLNLTLLNSGPTWEGNLSVGNARAMNFKSVDSPVANQVQTNLMMHFNTPTLDVSTSTIFVVDEVTNSDRPSLYYEMVTAGGVPEKVYTNVAPLVGNDPGILSTQMNDGSAGCGQAPASSPEVFRMAWNIGSGTCASNNYVTNAVSIAKLGTTSGDIGGHYAQGYSLRDTMVAYLVFPEVLTPAQIEQVTISLELMYNIQPQKNQILYMNGDSECAGGISIYGNSILNSMYPLLKSQVTAYDVCEPGSTTANMLLFQTNEYTSLPHPASANTIELFGIGLNDLRAQIPLATVKTNIQQIITNFHSHVPSGKVGMVAWVEQCDIANNSVYPTELSDAAALVAWLALNKSQAQGGPGADLPLVNLWADPIVGGNGYAAANNSDTNVPFCNAPNVLTADGEHALDVTTKYIAGDYANVLNPFLH